MLNTITSQSSVSSLAAQPPNTKLCCLGPLAHHSPPCTSRPSSPPVPTCWHNFLRNRREVPSLTLLLKICSVGHSRKVCGKICFLFGSKGVLRVTRSNCNFRVESLWHVAAVLTDCLISVAVSPLERWLWVKFLRFLCWEDIFVSI